MKIHCNKNALLFGFALMTLISAGIYFADFEFSEPSNPSHADIGVKDNSRSVKLNDQTNKPQKFVQKDKAFASPEINDQTRPLESETITVPVSDANFNAPAAGEYADQINQEEIIAKAKGYQAQLTEPDPAMPPISNKDVDTPSTGDYADQINQQAISAKSKGHQAQLIEPDPAIPPISDKDAGTQSTGEYADQINQQAIMAKAKSEGYLAPDVP
ncbi:MAG: hypothetical protein ACOYMG_04370 [Candidatus Methylumidiphilus sp.]